MSYSFYLVHGLMLNVLKAALDFARLPESLPAVAVIALFMLAFAFATAGSAVLFLAVEKPFSLRRGSTTARALCSSEVSAGHGAA
jgi:peptidoglycan/LPS O-acetylase OafA/YrhL